MAGDPTGDALSLARLVPTTCAVLDREAHKRADELVKEMRASVDESLRSWASGCTEAVQSQRMVMLGALNGGSGLQAGVGAGGPIRPGGGGLGALRGGETGGASAASEPPATAKSTSGTNNQVAGVDEADIIKTDGRYVYAAMNGALRIIEALKPRIVSVTRLPGDVRDLFVLGDRAVVFTASRASEGGCTYGYDCTFAGDGSSTTIVVLDLADREHPKVVRKIELSGSLLASRRIGSAVHTVVADGDYVAYESEPQGVSCENLNAVSWKFAKLKADNERLIRARGVPTIREKNVQKRLCEGTLRASTPDGRAYTTVASFDMLDDAAPAATVTVQSRPGPVFASSNALYFSVMRRKWSDATAPWYASFSELNEVSEIHKFTIGEHAADTRYAASGVVPGHALNQFSMDEWYGYLRTATTQGHVRRGGDGDVKSSVSILVDDGGGHLLRVGAIDGIAPGEDIRSVRFDGDRGYVVTFKKTDPLFVVDLYDPAHPALLGELKIPGFSTYMHRIDPDHLLSIGFDADDHGDFAYFNGLLLQLFDVRDPTAPKLLHRETIGTRGSKALRRPTITSRSTTSPTAASSRSRRRSARGAATGGSGRSPSAASWSTT